MARGCDLSALRFSRRGFHAHVGWILLLMVSMCLASAFGWTPRYDRAMAARSGGTFEGLKNEYEGESDEKGDDEGEDYEKDKGVAVTDAVAGTDAVTDAECPDVLVKSGPMYYMYNTRQAEVPGVNPIRFSGLDEYREYVEWQRMTTGRRCPVLSVEETLNAQGGVSYVGHGRRNPQSQLAPNTWQDVAARSESVFRFDREHDQLCGEGSLVHPQFCITDRDKFDAMNRSSGYMSRLDGPVTSSIAGSGIYAYDPDNQYIGMRTAIDKANA